MPKNPRWPDAKSAFLASLLVFLAIILIAPIASAQECRSNTDCPAPDCAGALRVCRYGRCSQTPCAIQQQEVKPAAEEGEGVPAEYMPYMDLLGLNNKVTSDNVKQGFLNMINFEKTTDTAIMLGLVFVIGLVLAVLIQAIRSGSAGRILILILALTAIIVIVFNVFATRFIYPNTQWQSRHVEDFKMDENAKQKTYLAAYGSDLYSMGATNAEQYTVNTPSGETSVSIIEFQDRKSIDNLKVIGSEFRDEDVKGEIVYKADVEGNRLYIWDEDRFVFMVAGDDKMAREQVEGIVKQYPGSTYDTFSMLNLRDNSAPTLSAMSPAENAITNSGMIYFTILDNMGVIKNSITIAGADGFSVDSCRSINRGYWCELDAHPTNGLNTILIRAQDTSGNQMSSARNFFYDTEPPYIYDIEPKSGSLTNSTRISFSVKDEVSLDNPQVYVSGVGGFRDFKTDCIRRNTKEISCSFIADLGGGINSAAIRVIDTAGNLAEALSIYTYKVSPKIRVIKPEYGSYSNDNEFLFLVTDETGRIQQSILVTGQFGYGEADCKRIAIGFFIQYNCSFYPRLEEGKNTITISTVDDTGVVSKNEVTFSYDTTAPEITEIEVVDYPHPYSMEKSKKIKFVVKDAGSGLDPSGINIEGSGDIKDASIDCRLQPQDRYTCEFNAIGLARGTHKISISAEDAAGNRAESSIDIMV